MPTSSYDVNQTILIFLKFMLRNALDLASRAIVFVMMFKAEEDEIAFQRIGRILIDMCDLPFPTFKITIKPIAKCTAPS